MAYLTPLLGFKEMLASLIYIDVNFLFFYEINVASEINSVEFSSRTEKNDDENRDSNCSYSSIYIDFSR